MTFSFSLAHPMDDFVLSPSSMHRAITSPYQNMKLTVLMSYLQPLTNVHTAQFDTFRDWLILTQTNIYMSEIPNHLFVPFLSNQEKVGTYGTKGASNDHHDSLTILILRRTESNPEM